MPDGLYRDEDGNRVFPDDLSPVEGINNYGQMEPPSKQLGGDTDTKNLGEDEENEKELASAKVESEKF